MRTFPKPAFVGQHAKAGTDFSHLTHTGWFNVIDYQVNGISIGEYGQLALCARELGVPTIFAAGEKALCQEAEALTPGVVCTSVKEGLLQDGLDDLDTDIYMQAKLSAVHVSPKKSRELIYHGAKTSLEKLRNDPTSFHYVEINAPFKRTVRYRTYEALNEPAQQFSDEHASSFIGLMNLEISKKSALK